MCLQMRLYIVLGVHVALMNGMTNFFETHTIRTQLPLKLKSIDNKCLLIETTNLALYKKITGMNQKLLLITNEFIRKVGECPWEDLIMPHLNVFDRFIWLEIRIMHLLCGRTYLSVQIRNHFLRDSLRYFDY